MQVQSLSKRRSLADSRLELNAMIEMSVQRDRLEQFIEKVEAESANLDKQDRERLEALITEARKLLGAHSALENFMSWRPPEERGLDVPQKPALYSNTSNLVLKELSTASHLICPKDPITTS